MDYACVKTKKERIRVLSRLHALSRATVCKALDVIAKLTREWLLSRGKFRFPSMFVCPTRFVGAEVGRSGCLLPELIGALDGLGRVQSELPQVEDGF